MSDQLLEEVRRLLVAAEAAHGSGTPAQLDLADARARLDGPLVVAFAGKVKAGKSTLLNALVGERLAPTDAGECTRIVSLYQRGLGYRVEACYRDGSTELLPFERGAGAIDIHPGPRGFDDVERLMIHWPSSSLDGLTLIDTPGIASLSDDASARAAEFLTPDDERPTEADAVIYLMRHLHAADRKFLETFHDQELSRASPVNTLAVLSRADEIGVGRLDAMASARRIAVRYQADPQIRRLCQSVIPVAGLIAEAAGTLRQDEYQAFSVLASAPRTRVDALMVSVDRFANHDDGCGLLPAEREHLLLRFGLFGVRLSVALIRHEVVTTAAGLADELTKRSGLAELRDVLQTLFTERRSVLKARGGLLRVRAVLDSFGDPSGMIDAELERVWANAHEMAELRLLNAVRSRQVRFDSAVSEQVERAVGASGMTPEQRLGIDGPTDLGAMRARAVELIGSFRGIEQHPLTTRDQGAALAVAIRSLEHVLLGLDPDKVDR